MWSSYKDLRRDSYLGGNPRKIGSVFMEWLMSRCYTTLVLSQDGQGFVLSDLFLSPVQHLGDITSGYSVGHGLVAL